MEHQTSPGTLILRYQHFLLVFFAVSGTICLNPLNSVYIPALVSLFRKICLIWFGFKQIHNSIYFFIHNSKFIPKKIKILLLTSGLKEYIYLKQP